jgi:hypothetical protein
MSPFDKNSKKKADLYWSACSNMIPISRGRFLFYTLPHTRMSDFCAIPRNLSDDQVKTIAERDGMIGLNAFSAL